MRRGQRKSGDCWVGISLPASAWTIVADAVADGFLTHAEELDPNDRGLAMTLLSLELAAKEYPHQHILKSLWPKIRAAMRVVGEPTAAEQKECDDHIVRGRV